MNDAKMFRPHLAVQPQIEGPTDMHGLYQPAGQPADRFCLFIPSLVVNDETGDTMP